MLSAAKHLCRTAVLCDEMLHGACPALQHGSGEQRSRRVQHDNGFALQYQSALVSPRVLRL